MWLDFPSSALQRLAPFFLFLTKTLTSLSAWFHVFFSLTPVPFLSSTGGSIYTSMCEWGNATSNKCVCLCSPPCTTMWIHIKEKQKRERTRGDLFWKLKKQKKKPKSASMRVQIKARPARGRQTTATEMAVAGMFQRSDARRYILIHGRLAPRLTGGKNEQI